MPDNEKRWFWERDKEPTGTPTATVPKPPGEVQSPPVVGTPVSFEELFRKAKLLSDEIDTGVSEKITPSAPTMPAEDLRKAFAKTQKGIRFEKLHSEGIPFIEWQRFTESEKKGLTKAGEGLDVHSGILQEGIPGETATLYDPEGEQRVFATGKPSSGFEQINEAGIKAAQTPVTVGPITASAGEWAGIFGIAAIAGSIVISGLPVAYNLLNNAAYQRNINKWSTETNTPVSPALRKAAADYFARMSKPSFANTMRSIKELFKPSATGKFKPTPQAEAQAEAHAKDLVTRFMPEFTKTRTDKTISDMAAGKFDVGIPPSVQAVQGVEARLGQPAEIRKELPTITADKVYKTVQAEAKKKGMDVEAVQGISPKEYWVGISLPKLTGSPEFTEWLTTIRNKNPEAANQIEKLLVGKFDFKAATAYEPFGRKRFIPFKNIEDAQRFVTTGDITARASKIELKGQPITPTPITPEVTREELIKQLEANDFAGTADRLKRGLITEEQARGELAGTLKPEVGAETNLLTANAADVIADIKARGFDKQTGYGQFVKARNLKPELDMKAFSKIYDSVSAKPFKPLAIPKAEVTPTEAPVVPTPTAIEKPVAPPEAVSEGIPPSEPPIPPETGITPEPIIEPSGRISFANLQDAQTVIDYSTKPDVSRWIANLPAIKQLMSKLNPSAIAGTPGEKAIVARNVLREEGTQKAQGVISYLNELGTQEKVFGKLDDNGFIASGKLKGLSVNDIRTYPKRYADRLSPSQQEWVTRAHEIEVAKLKFMRDNDIEVQELSFMEGGEYAGRRVYALMSSDGELLDTAFVGAGPTRVGKKTAFEKRRSFVTAKEALDEGYRYLPDDEALALNVRAAYNRVADKKMSDWLLSQVPWRTTGAPEELVLAAEAAKIRTNSSKQLLAALNRAVRGERVPDATLNSIARTYPKEAAELKNLIPQIQAGKPTAKVVQSLTKRAKALIASDNKDKWAAINARARAREAAMSPKFGEAMIMHPAFSGKIFTGSEAKELAETMRNALEPRISHALESMNKVNALVRYFKLAGDFSPLCIQLIFLAGQNPKIYGGAAASIPRILLDTEFQAKFLSEHKATIDRHPGLLLSTAGTEFTEAMAKGGMLSTKINVWPKQDAMLKKLGLVAPRVVGKAAATVLTPFQRVFEGTLDYAGIKMAEALEHLGKTPAEMAEVDQFINEFRGLTSSAKLGVNPNWRAGETATLLAPRYNRAIAALLADAAKGAVSFGQSGLRNRLAIQGLTKGIAAISAMAVAISLALGEDEEDIKEHFDPNSTRFFTWTIAGTNIGPGTKVRSVVKLVAQIIDNPEALLQMSMDNPALRFIRGNLAPVAGSAISLLTGKDYIGDPVRSDVATFTREMLVKNFLPIWVENVVYEGGELSQRLLRGAGEFFGGRAYPETESDQVNRLRERYAAQVYGKKYEDLNNSQRDSLREKHNDLDEIEKEAKKMWAEKGSDIERFYYNEKQRITNERNAGLEKAAQSYLDGGISKYDYDKQRGYIRPYYSGGSEVLWSVKESLDEYSVKQMEKWIDDNIKPEDKALGEYQQYRGELIETADLPVDWDVLERELESYLTKYSPDVRAYILDNMNNWINDLPPAAKQVEQERTSGIEDETWWDNYRDAKKTTTPSRSTRPSTSGGNRFWNK